MSDKGAKEGLDPKPGPPFPKGVADWKDSLALVQQDFQLLKDEQAEQRDIAKRVRGRLYLVALATGAVVHLGAVPTKFDTLGIEFSQLQQAFVPLFLGVVSAYLTFRFYYAQRSADHYSKQIAHTWGWLHGMSEHVHGRRVPSLADRHKEAAGKARFSFEVFLERRIPTIAGSYATVISTVPLISEMVRSISQAPLATT